MDHIRALINWCSSPDNKGLLLQGAAIGSISGYLGGVNEKATAQDPERVRLAEESGEKIILVSPGADIERTVTFLEKVVAHNATACVLESFLPAAQVNLPKEEHAEEQRVALAWDPTQLD